MLTHLPTEIAASVLHDAELDENRARLPKRRRVDGGDRALPTPERRLTPTPAFDLNVYRNDQPRALTDLRFSLEEIGTIIDVLRWPSVLVTRGRTNVRCVSRYPI